MTRTTNYHTYEYVTALPSTYDDKAWHGRWFTINNAWAAQFYAGNPQTPTYDLDGNMTFDGSTLSTGVKDTAGYSLNYAYDTENRLTAAYNRDYRVELTYDYLGRRVRQVTKTNDSALTTRQDLRFVYDGWHMIATESVSGSTFTVKNAYTWGLDVSGTRGGAGGIGGLVAWYDYTASKKYAPSYDGRGNVSLVYGLTDAHVISEYEYDPYGRMLRTTGYTYASSTWSMVSYDPVNNPFRYQTKWHLQGNLGVDRDSGFTQFDIYDYGKRWYHPKQGRFINRDPIGEQGGRNLYGYCGNDPINQIDMLGQSWLSSFLHNPGKALKHLWKEIRPVVTVAAAIVAAYYTGAYVGSWLYSSESALTLEATATGFSATVSTTTSGYLAGSGMSAVTATTISSAAAGAASGFTGGALGTAFAGGDLGDSLTAGLQGAVVGGGISFLGSRYFHMNPSTKTSYANMRYQLATTAARREIGRFTEHQWGIDGWMFNMGLEGVSWAGYKLLGDPYNRKLEDDTSFIGGFGSRDPDTGLLFKTYGHWAGEFLFDVNDQILLWQGLPDAGMLTYAYNGKAFPTIGHSEGASRMSVARALGLVDSGSAIAQPFGMVAPDGIQPVISWGDAITGFGMGQLFNPGASVVDVPFITGHLLDSYYPEVY